MRYFRRLPPLLRVASIAGLLFVLACIALMINYLVTGLYAHRDSSSVSTTAVNLLLLGMACSFSVNSYSTRFRQPGLGPFPLDSWQSQVRAILLLSALPLCGIALALIISPTSPAFFLVGWLAAMTSLLAAVVLLVANIVLLASRGPAQTPQAE